MKFILTEADVYSLHEVFELTIKGRLKTVRNDTWFAKVSGTVEGCF